MLLLSCENGDIPGMAGLSREGPGVVTLAGLSRVSSVSEQQWRTAACRPAQASIPSHGPWAPDIVFQNIRVVFHPCLHHTASQQFGEVAHTWK